MSDGRTTSLRSRLTRALVGLGLVSVILLATVYEMGGLIVSDEQVNWTQL